MRTKTRRFDNPGAAGVAKTSTNPFYTSIEHPRIILVILHLHVQLVVDLPIPIMLGRTSEPHTTWMPLDLTPFDGENMGVSRQHLLMSILDKRLVVEDQKSSNGTLVNKKQITQLRPFPISHGDLLELGKMQILVQFLSDIS